MTKILQKYSNFSFYKYCVQCSQRE